MIATKDIFARIKLKLFRTGSTKNPDGYKDLAPLDSISDGNVYLEALDWAINNPRVKNIALTGPYGSGKSSVIQSYIKTHSYLKFINVSFAAFQENFQDKRDPDKSDSDAIEEGILKQLFYRVDHKEIPQSRYRKLHRMGYIRPMIEIGVIALVFVLFSYGFFPEKFAEFCNLIIQAGSRFHLNKTGSIIATIVTFIIGDYIIADIFRNLRGKVQLKEVKLPTNTTIATENEGESSVFNRNLDEIVYYFEEMKYDVVFFEDLDRLNNAEIFVKLRELNILLNNDKAIKKTVKFVYAVRDDIFTDKDRTKFFEFIIPIVPIINSTNSGEILSQLVKEAPEKTNISAEYIQNMSPFISDMRLLQNAFNEFLIYKRTLQFGQSLNLEDQAMLSLVIFKNLYPKEFADLQAEEGIVKQAFKDKAKAIEELHHKLQDEINAETDLLEGVRSDCLNNRRELVVSFFCDVTNWQGVAYQVTIKGSSYRLDELLKEEFDLSQIIFDFSQIISTGGANLNVSGLYFLFTGQGGVHNLNESIPISVFETYAKRFESISLNEADKAENLRHEIEDKKQRMNSIGGASLKELIEKYGVEKVLSDNVRAIKPLVYMLRMGYIDERYADYINYFKGTSITTADMNFILSVKNHESQPFNYELTKVDQIVSRLQPYEFEQEEILNFDLLEFLLSDDVYKEKRLRFIKRIADGSKSSLQFLDEFAEKTSHIQGLFHNIAAAWPELWDRIVKDVLFTVEKKNHYLRRILSYADLTDIVAMNANGNISDYFIEDASILEVLSDVSPDKMIEVIDALEIQFSDVELKNAEKTIADHIINEDCYEICLPMIHRITEYINPGLLQDLEIKNYTTLLFMDSQSVLKYVHANWNKYINEIILTNSNTEEECSTVIKLLEKTLPDTEICIQIINHLNFKMDSLKDCSFDEILQDQETIKPVWCQLLIENKLSQTWYNVILFWNRFGLTKELLDYVERNATILKKDDSSDVDEGFIRQYLCTTGDDDSYRIITGILKLERFDLKISDIPENRVAVLLENRYFDFSVNIYDQIHSTYDGLSVSTILAYQSECIKWVDSIEMDSLTLSSLIQSESASEELKKYFLEAFGESCMSEELASELCVQMYSITIPVFWKAWDYLDEKHKKELMYNYLSVLKADDFERCFADINEFAGMHDRVRHNVDLVDNENNRRLAKRLQAVDYITSWKYKNKENEIIVCIVKDVK